MLTAVLVLGNVWAFNGARHLSAGAVRGSDMGTDRDGSFDMVIETFKIIAIIITMVALAAGRAGRGGCGGVPRCRHRVDLAVPVGALACGAVNCVVMSSHKHG
jgi:hypothetical protein